MKRNRITEMLRRECPKCGAFGARGERECPKCDWDAYWDFRKKAATGSLICLVVFLGIYFVARGADENPWLWGTLLVLLIAVIPITWYVLNNRKEKASVQPKTMAECRALIVSVGGQGDYAGQRQGRLYGSAGKHGINVVTKEPYPCHR